LTSSVGRVKTTKYFGKTHFDLKKIKAEERPLCGSPKIYEFRMTVEGDYAEP
jgi:hypothetical protein